MIPLFQDIGKKTNKVSICLGWASLGYDVVDATLSKDFEKSLRIATSGSAGILTGTLVSGYIIGLAGTTFLVATPIGWAVVIVTGVVAGNYVGEKTKEVVEYAFDGTADLFKNRHQQMSSASKAASQVGQFFYKINLVKFNY